MTAKKVYAVARGRAVGIFTSWSECEKQVRGFAGARFQSFTDVTAALAWLSGAKGTASAPAPASTQAKKNATFMSPHTSSGPCFS